MNIKRWKKQTTNLRIILCNKFVTKYLDFYDLNFYEGILYRKIPGKEWETLPYSYDNLLRE